MQGAFLFAWMVARAVLVLSMTVGASLRVPLRLRAGQIFAHLKENIQLLGSLKNSRAAVLALSAVKEDLENETVITDLFLDVFAVFIL
jgi:hypothetical protein